MRIKEIESRDTWNNFLLSIHPNTFLQSWQWGQVQRRAGEGVRYLGLYDGTTQIGAALLVTVRARRGRHLLIPHGPIFTSDDQARVHLPELVEYCQNIGRADGAVALRIAPLLEQSTENRQAFHALGFRDAPLHVHAELTWVLDITGSESDILAGMRKTTRQAIQKAQRAGVTVQLSPDPAAMARFFPLYRATQRRHGFVPFPEDTLSAQAEEFAQDGQMYIAIARYRGRDVAAGLFIHFSNTIFYHHGASQQLSSPLPVSHLLQWQSIREARRRGAVRYNFWGIAPPNKPHHPFAGITVFKTGFGGRAINYIHAQDLPLSVGYWKLWAVEMWRKFRRGF